ncbi:hypothetical protein FRD01_03155 [Microvenator marinus]|uniref:Uncharacterized protein n=1 Tax=Microvenator marinus TaxID=2600177 RepID=A0A5B8XS83_9DELT|nr:hypothetical protein [Microvenator marinus]QED26269.1 hypothetical protein FRD01_03155 [Microvenator marinus]
MTRHFFPLLLIILSVWSTGCAPQIGDECETNVECPSGAICDNTVYEGYCTLPDCERDSCPDDSVCVRFDAEQTFCMKYCEASSDCRDGYACRSDIGEKSFCYVPESSPN